jgi:thiol-disulfide isomerase/thioredoxin
MAWESDSEQPADGSRGRGSGRLIGLLVGLGIALFAVVLARTMFRSALEAPAPAVGHQLSKLDLRALDSNEEKITAADLQGQVVLINFWGPWCGPCRLEFPELMELQKDLAKTEDFRFLSVTSMPNDNETDLVPQTKAFLESQGYDLAVHRDPTFATRVQMMQLNQGQFAFPTTVLLDRSGTIRQVWIGYRPDVGLDMRRAIDGLLAEKGGAEPK